MSKINKAIPACFPHLTQFVSAYFNCFFRFLFKEIYNACHYSFSVDTTVSIPSYQRAASPRSFMTQILGRLSLVWVTTTTEILASNHRLLFSVRHRESFCTYDEDRTTTFDGNTILHLYSQSVCSPSDAWLSSSVIARDSRLFSSSREQTIVVHIWHHER